MTADAAFFSEAFVGCIMYFTYPTFPFVVHSLWNEISAKEIFVYAVNPRAFTPASFTTSGMIAKKEKDTGGAGLSLSDTEEKHQI